MSELTAMTTSSGLEGSRDAAVAAMYQQHWVGMVRLAMLMLGDLPSAEDVAQEGFAELYRRWDKVRDHTKAVTYLRSTVLNKSRSLLRRRIIARGHGPRYEPPAWSAESEVMNGEDRRNVLRALDKLSSRKREVLVMRFYFELSDKEIAGTLGVSEGAVRAAASRGLADLGRALEGLR